MDPIDNKIISILTYGKKNQKEIVALLDNERSGRTIRRHLNNLEEAGRIDREGDSGPFYLPNQNREPVQPKPFADQDEINRILFNIEEEFDIFSSAFYEFHDDKTIAKRILSWLSVSKDTGNNIEIPEQDGDLIHQIQEFHRMSSSNHYVLQNKQNLNSFFRIFDSAIEILEDHDSDQGVLIVPDLYFMFLFMSANNLYRNWFNGKENEEFDSRMTDRAERILSIFESNQSKFESNQSKFHSEMRSLLTNINREDSKKVYIAMVKSGKYDQERMLEDAFYTYDAFNEINKLLEDLNDAQQEVEDQTTAQSISQLQKNVVRLYTRELQEIT